MASAKAMTEKAEKKAEERERRLETQRDNGTGSDREQGKHRGAETADALGNLRARPAAFERSGLRQLNVRVAPPMERLNLAGF
jgi:hypothetical protein